MRTRQQACISALANGSSIGTACTAVIVCRFQIVDLPDGVDSDLNNGSWRIGDWADTLELPNIGFQAIVRWIPGPIEITGKWLQLQALGPNQTTTVLIIQYQYSCCSDFASLFEVQDQSTAAVSRNAPLLDRSSDPDNGIVTCLG